MLIFKVLKKIPSRQIFSRNLIKSSQCVYYNQIKYLSSKPQQTKIKEVDPITGEIKKKKINEIPKITLLSDETIQVTTLNEAEKLARRRELKLVKIIDLDTKSNRPIYKLMSGHEYHAEDLKQRQKRKEKKLNERNQIKGEKVLTINSKINEHDLQTQLRKTIKWINKMYEVRIIINCSTSNNETGDKIYNMFENYIKSENSSAKLVQKRFKGNDLKFQILPSSNKEEKNNL